MGGGPSRDAQANALEALCVHLRIPVDAELLRQLYGSIHLSSAVYFDDDRACADALRILEGRVMERGEPVPFARIQRTLPHAFQPSLWAEDESTLYVAFRGSQEPRDWAVNFTADAVSDPDLGVVHKVRPGGAPAPRPAAPRPPLTGRRRRVPVRAIVETAARLCKRLVLCGHSMGGAVACLVLARILLTAEREPEAARPPPRTPPPPPSPAGRRRAGRGGRWRDGTLLHLRAAAVRGAHLAARFPWHQHVYPFVADNDIVPFVQMLIKGAFGGAHPAHPVSHSPPHQAGSGPGGVAGWAPRPADKLLLGFLRPDDLSYRPLSRMWVIEDSKSASPTPEKPPAAASAAANAARANVPVELRVVDAAHFDSKIRGHHLAPFGELYARHSVDNYVLLLHRLTAGYSYAWPAPPYSTFNAPSDIAPRPAVSPASPHAPRPALADRDASPHGFSPPSDSPPGCFGAVEGLTGQLVFKASGPNLYTVTAAELRYEQVTYTAKELSWAPLRAPLPKDPPAAKPKGRPAPPDQAPGTLAAAFERPGTRCGETHAELRLFSDFYCVEAPAVVLFARVLLLGPTGSGKTTLVRAVAQRVLQQGKAGSPPGSLAAAAAAALPEQTHLVPNRRSGEGVVRFGFLELLDRNGLERYTAEEVAAFRRDFLAGPDDAAAPGYRRPAPPRPAPPLFSPSLTAAGAGAGRISRSSASRPSPPSSPPETGPTGPRRPPRPARAPAAGPAPSNAGRQVRGLLAELRAAGVPVLPVLTNVFSVDQRAGLPVKLHALERHLGVRPDEWVRVNSEEINGRPADVGPVVEAIGRALSRDGTRAFSSGVAAAWSTELDAALKDRVAWAVFHSAVASAAVRAAPVAAPVLLLLLWLFRPR
eukprot:tig00021719_g23157.t1